MANNLSTREQKIQMLKNIQAGKASVKDLQETKFYVVLPSNDPEKPLFWDGMNHTQAEHDLFFKNALHITW